MKKGFLIDNFINKFSDEIKNLDISKIDIREKIDFLIMYLYLIPIDDIYLKKVLDNIELIFKEIASINNLSLLTKICYIIKSLLTYLNKNSKLYFQFLRIENIFNNLLYITTNTVLSEITKMEFINNRYYDTLYGLSGVCRYLMLDRKKNYNLINKINNWFIELTINTENIFDKDNKRKSFFIYNNQINTIERRNKFPNGYLDIGLAHGISGPLMILILNYKYSNNKMKQKKAIEIIINFINQATFNFNNQIYIQGFLDGYIIEKKIYKPSWCYGNSGVFRIVNIYAKKFKNKNLEEQSLKALLDLKNINFNSNIFCHGWSGFYHSINLFNENYDFEKFGELSNEIENKIINSIKRNKKDFLNKFKKEEGFIYNISILDGIFSVFIPIIIKNYNIKLDIFSYLFMLK